MTSLIQSGKIKRGRPAIIDNQHFSYVSNGPATMPKTDYLKMLAHDLQRASAL